MSNLYMKQKVKPLITFGLAGLLFALVPNAFSNDDVVECSDEQCKTQDELIFRVISKGEDAPVVQGDSASDLQHNRRVDVEYQEAYSYDETGVEADKRRTDVSGNMLIRLENGGLLWATEDPAITQPVLGANLANTVAFKDGQIAEPLQLSYYNNYSAFVERLELVVFDGTDSDLVTPLSTIQLPVVNHGRFEWDGQLTLDRELVLGDELQYVIRAYDKDGRFDETYTKRILLVTPEEKKSNLVQLRNTVQDRPEATAEQLANELVATETFGANNLRQQNIPIYGSRVRIFGQDIPRGQQVKVNDGNIPVDQEGKFVAEYLLPVGQHKFDVQIGGKESRNIKELNIDVTGEHMFVVALADITASKSSVSSGIQSIDSGDTFDEDFLLEGRLAFYLKGKIQGKYLITAQADTQERELGDMFDGFLDADPRDVFRRLDPDRYYPVYGDDSTTYRDVDTQGRFYVRVDWDKSQALWGNFNTGITGNEMAQYSRSLYGAAVNWRSIDTTELGEAQTQLKAFASEAQTAFGHVEFLGTGGSLYYLKHSDILPGSDRVVLEVRDPTTGRVETTIDLQRGADYEIDELQGRIILTRPLAQITRQNIGTIIRDQALDGLDNVLLVDYEYLPSGFDSENTTLGGRAKVWLNDNVAIGGTFIDENRSGDDYELSALDLTLQAGRGTYIKVESAESRSDQAASFYSDNGGFSFVTLAADPTNSVTNKKGNAFSVEARANFKELGWTDLEWNAGAWHRTTDAGYSVARRTLSNDVDETGLEFSGNATKDVTVSARISEIETGANSLEQAQVAIGYQMTPSASLTAEVRQIDETINGNTVSGTLGAIQYTHRFESNLELYGVGQFTLENDGGTYDNNDLVTIGSRYVFGERSSLGAEYSSGHRGDAWSVTADYKLNNEHTLYGRYTYSTDTTDSIFGPAVNDGITLGQRWRVSNQVTLYNESQQLKSPQETGLVHTFGLDFVPSEGWNIGLSLHEGSIESVNGDVDRNGATLSGGFRSPEASWTSKLEYRKDKGSEQREQWLTTNRLNYKLSDDWRLAARINYSETEDELNAQENAKFVESNLGFAYRPVDNDDWSLLGKYTYLYDLRTFVQDPTGSDQKSDIYSFEGIYRLNHEWEFAGKIAHRRGQVRSGRGLGNWLSSTADLYAIQTRYHLLHDWDAIAEYRVLKLKESQDRRSGWLVGADYHISEHFKVGVGYNLTDFSDKLSDLDYNYGGWFLNFVGKY